MINDTQDKLDPIAFEILLLLSGGQKLSIHEIVRAIDQPLNIVWTAMQTLRIKNLIHENKGKFELSDDGFEYLAKKGISATKPGDDPSPKSYYKKLKLPFFGTWKDLILWFIAPLSLFFIDVLAFAWLARGFNTVLSRLIILGGGLLIYFAFFLVYIKKSYHSVVESERLVIFRLGKCEGAKGPGPILIIPFIDNPKIVDLREKPKEVPHETCITQDNVQIDVDFVFYWKIEDPVLSLTKVTNPDESITLLATALLRAVIAHYPFNAVLNQRESINDLLKDKIDKICSEWGVYVSTMEIREIKPPEEIVKSMHNQRAAEWDRQATITLAEGQVEALRLLFAVASQLDSNTLNLKYFETLQKIGEGKATKYIFPMELSNIVNSWLNQNQNNTNGNNDQQNNGNTSSAGPVNLLND